MMLEEYLTHHSTVLGLAQVHDSLNHSKILEMILSSLLHSAVLASLHVFKVLSDEETFFTNFLIKCAKIGYPRTVSEIPALVQQTVSLKGFTSLSILRMVAEIL